MAVATGAVGAVVVAEPVVVIAVGEASSTPVGPAGERTAPAEMTPAAIGGEEVPPAPEVKGTTGTQGGLLLPTPSGN